jgi:hypothetical protein
MTFQSERVFHLKYILSHKYHQYFYFFQFFNVAKVMTINNEIWPELATEHIFLVDLKKNPSILWIQTIA